MAHKDMDSRLRADILSRLHSEFEGVDKGNYMQKVRCPSCGKREAFVSMDNPWMLKCGRENNCGDQYHVKELFPELFSTWSERFGRPVPVKDAKGNSTEAQPHPTAVADAYLTYGRGFELEKVQGWYSQESFFDPKLNIGSATVRFALPGNGYWERLLDAPERFGKMKANFKPGYGWKGTWWVPPGVDLLAIDELWIVEGIFDAIALYHNGIAAVAAFTCNTYPQQALDDLKKTILVAGGTLPTLVWALDGDAAGQRYIKKWCRLSASQDWKSEAAIIPGSGKAKKDWNDAHQRGELADDHIEKYRYYGSLCIAKSAAAKALLMYHRNPRQEFLLEHDFKTYAFKLDLDKYLKAIDRYIEDLSDEEAQEKALKESGSIQQIANCSLQALYYQANLVTDESWYYWRVTFPHGAKVKNTFSGGQLSSASEFKKRLMGIAAGGIWTGSAGHLDKLLNEQITNIKSVETIDFIGYSRDHAAWIFQELAVHKGKVHRLNDEDYFDIGRMAVKTLSQSVPLHINTDLNKYSHTAWSEPLIQCFGHQGVVALAFWVGTLFAEQIRQLQKSWPFLEIVGEAGSGKTTLIEFLWKLVGRADYEGFDPAKSTAAARRRTFNQVAALPTVLIESDREDSSGGSVKQKQFDWDELKPLYNGRSTGSTGVKNAGNETYNAPFRSSIVIAQNAQVEASEAVLQRIIHMTFTRAGHNPTTKQLASLLEKMPVEKVSGFALVATQAEARIMQIITERTPAYEAELSAHPQIRIHRIAKNHAQLMALTECLGPNGLNIYSKQQLDEVLTGLRNMAIARQESISADHPMVAEFWEVYDYLQDSAHTLNGQVNHYGRDGKQIAINLRHFEQLANERRINLPPVKDLKRFLRTSRKRKFVDSNVTVRSAIRQSDSGESITLKCWIFEK